MALSCEFHDPVALPKELELPVPIGSPNIVRLSNSRKMSGESYLFQRWRNIFVG
jgi:hypothetical protein